MAKRPVSPGISARVLDLLLGVQPEGMSERAWCLNADVSTSFFTDLRKGTEPGIDKIERLARVARLTLSDFFDGAGPPVEVIPSEAKLEAMLQEIVDEIPARASISDWPRYGAPILHALLTQFRDGRPVLDHSERAQAGDGSSQLPASTKRAETAQ